MSTDLQSTVLQVDSFLRIASISVGGYHYLCTLPVELRLYRSITTLNFGWSVSVVSFILIRYTSIVLLTLSNVGWFYHGFSPAACAKYFMIAPVFKVIQIVISQIIVGYRTWSISKRSKDVGTFLILFGSLIALLEAFANFQSRVPLQKGRNCSPGNASSRIPQWVFYLLSAVFDITTIVLSSFFLIKSSGGVGRMNSVIKMLFYDGLGYVVILTAVNLMNLVLYRNNVGNETQDSGASFGFMVVWIMSQSLLVHIHEAAEVRAHRQFTFNPNGRIVRTGKFRDDNGDINLDVQVQVEQAVMVDYNTKSHRIPRGPWGRKQDGVADGGSHEKSQWELSQSSVNKTGGDSQL